MERDESISLFAWEIMVLPLRGRPPAAELK